MNKYLVITTINSPTAAILKFCEKSDWNFLVVGDLKTPHDLYEKLEKAYPNFRYLSPEYQENTYKELSDAVGWNCSQRRNIGFLEAYRLGVDVLATSDDDNIPYENWGKNLLVGKTVEVDLFKPNLGVFDPLSVTNQRHLWHRGFPIELLQERHEVAYYGKVWRKVLVQADLWDGDPDIDALARLTYKPLVKFDIQEPYCADVIAPFDSQNTFLAREVIPYYAVLPYLGRMDDIWGSYILQRYFPNSVVYNKATVYQERNKQDLITNLENEIIGYRNTLKVITDLNNFEKYLPEKTLNFWKVYRKQFS